MSAVADICSSSVWVRRLTNEGNHGRLKLFCQEAGSLLRVVRCYASFPSLPLPSGWSLPAGSLDRWPEDYERGRPGWPPEAVVIPGLPSAATLLELGAGTGKLTRLLVSRFARVVAVEPEEAMRRLLVALCPDAAALAGSA